MKKGLIKIHEWYAKETQREVSSFDEFDYHICNVVYKYINDKNLK
jgi:hypothetical protein